MQNLKTAESVLSESNLYFVKLARVIFCHCRGGAGQTILRDLCDELTWRPVAERGKWLAGVLFRWCGSRRLNLTDAENSVSLKYSPGSYS